MTHYETAASDLPLSTLSVTERVFEGLAPRLEDVVIIDGTIRENISMGYSSAESVDEHILNILKLASLNDFLKERND